MGSNCVETRMHGVLKASVEVLEKTATFPARPRPLPLKCRAQVHQAVVEISQPSIQDDGLNIR
jgi:hypothetical protein